MEEPGSSYPSTWQELDLEESCLGQGYGKARWITGPYPLSVISLRVIPWLFFFSMLIAVKRNVGHVRREPTLAIFIIL